MNSDLNKDLTDALVAERLRQANRFRRARVDPQETPNTDPTVRLARMEDAEALARLAELDGRSVPSGSVLIAEVDGAVLAARSLESGASVADPFRPTVQLVELLELRSSHLRNAADREVRRRSGVRAWLRRALSTR